MQPALLPILRLEGNLKDLNAMFNLRIWLLRTGPYSCGFNNIDLFILKKAYQILISLYSTKRERETEKKGTTHAQCYHIVMWLVTMG